MRTAGDRMERILWIFAGLTLGYGGYAVVRHALGTGDHQVPRKGSWPMVALAMGLMVAIPLMFRVVSRMRGSAGDAPTRK